MKEFARHKYHTLDAIRGIASLLIVLRHTEGYFGGGYFAKSYLAVDLFFVLSGFVIAEAYDKRLASGLSVFDFVKIRLIRLYPLYLLGALLGIFYSLINIIRGHSQLTFDYFITSILAIFMLPSPISSSLYPRNEPSWSLFFELISNGLYVLFYKKLTTRLLLISIALSASILMYSVFRHGNLDAGFLWKDFYIGLARVLFSFSIGVLIQRKRVGTNLLQIKPWIMLLIVLALFCYNPATEVSGIYDFFTVVLIFPVIVYFSSYSESTSSATIKVYTFLGTISYAIYLLHVPVSKILTDGFRGLLKLDVAEYAPLSGIFLLLFLIGTSWLIDSIYDKPLRKKATELFISLNVLNKK